MAELIKDYREVYNIFNNEIPISLKNKKKYGKIRISQALVLASKSFRQAFKDFHIDHVESEEEMKLYVIYCYSKYFKKCNDMDNPPMYSIIMQRDKDKIEIVSVKKSVIQ